MLTREAEVASYGDMAIKLIARQLGKSPKTVAVQRHVANKRGCGELTAAQLRVLHEYSRGYSAKEVARSLDMPLGTVKAHKYEAIARLGLAEWRRRVFRNG